MPFGQKSGLAQIPPIARCGGIGRGHPVDQRPAPVRDVMRIAEHRALIAPTGLRHCGGYVAHRDRRRRQ